MMDKVTLAARGILAKKRHNKFPAEPRKRASGSACSARGGLLRPPLGNRRRANPEAALHRAVAAYLEWALPANAWFTTFPAGGGGRIRGAQLKAMGLRAGVPDVLILHRRDETRVMWIELKARRGRLSEAQKFCHGQLDTLGCYVVTVHSVEEMEMLLLDWGVRLRARIGRKAA